MLPWEEAGLECESAEDVLTQKRTVIFHLRKSPTYDWRSIGFVVDREWISSDPRDGTLPVITDADARLECWRFMEREGGFNAIAPLRMPNCAVELITLRPWFDVVTRTIVIEREF